MVKSALTITWFIASVAIAGPALAQRNMGRVSPAPGAGPNCSDPSITAALQRIGKGSAADTGTSGLCDPKRYHDGQWSNEVQLATLVRQSFMCDEPWIGQIYGDSQVANSVPQGSGRSGECNPQLYGPGQWSSYHDLKMRIVQYRQSLQAHAAPPGQPAVAGQAPVPGQPPVTGGGWNSPPPPDNSMPDPPFFGPVTLPPEFTQATSQASGTIRADNAGIDGLADAVTKLGSDSPIDPEQAAQQIAFLEGYDALVELLSNPTQLIASAGEPSAVDPQVIASLVEQSHILEQHRAIHALYDEASLAAPGGFYIIYNVADDTCGLRKPTLQQRTDWSAYSRIETVVQQLRLASGFKAAAGVTGAVSSALDSLESAIDQQNLDMTPIPQVQAALKVEATASAIVTIADSMAKAGVAFMPNHISRFYTTIKGQPRNPNDPPVTINVGEEARVAAYIETGSPGGSIMTPYQAAKLVADRVLKLKKVKAWYDKLPAQKKANWDFAGELNKELTKRIKTAWSRVSNFPVIKGWADSVAQLWTIKPFRNPPTEINSDAVLNMASRSPNLIRVKVGNLPAKEHQYFIVGLAPGQQAGYHVGLKRDLIAELGPSSSVELTRLAVVNVGDSGPKGTPGDFGKPCDPRTGAIGSGPGTWMPTPANKWIPDGKGGVKPDPNGPWMCGEGQ